MSVDPLEPRNEVEQKLRSLLDERLDGLSVRIRQWLEESHARAGSLAEIIEQARNEPLLVEPGLVQSSTAGGATRELARFARDVEGATDQVAILGRLVSGAAAQSSRVVLFVVRNDTFVGWFARGLATNSNPRTIRTPVDGDTLLSRAHSQCRTLVESLHDHEGNEGLARLVGEAPVEGMLASPLWVRDRIVAMLYADTCEEPGAWDPDAIRVMVSLTALSLEALPARAKFPRPVVSRAALIEEPAPGFAARQDDEVRVEPEAQAPKAAPQAAAADPEESRRHEEARRFARLLVSEILLYNEKEIEEGRRKKDLYERLKEDIDRSRQMYLNRLTLTNGPDYFLQELVRSLAAGDESALNVPWG